MVICKAPLKLDVVLSHVFFSRFCVVGRFVALLYDVVRNLRI